MAEKSYSQLPDFLSILFLSDYKEFVRNLAPNEHERKHNHKPMKATILHFGLHKTLQTLVVAPSFPLLLHADRI